MVHKMLFRSKIFQTANQIQIRFEPPSHKLSLKHAQFYMMQSLKSLLVHYTDSANDLGSFSSIQTLMSNSHPLLMNPISLLIERFADF